MKELIFLLLLSASLYYIKEPYKERTKELCSRPNLIRSNSTPLKQGKLFDQPTMPLYKMPKYKYKTGFPLTGDDYVILKLKL